MLHLSFLGQILQMSMLPRWNRFNLGQSVFNGFVFCHLSTFGCVGCFSCYALAVMCANDARARVTLHIFAPDGLVDRPLVLSHAMQALVH